MKMSGKVRKKTLNLKKSDKATRKVILNTSPLLDPIKTSTVWDKLTGSTRESSKADRREESTIERLVTAENHVNGVVADVVNGSERDSDWEDVSECPHHKADHHVVVSIKRSEVVVTPKVLTPKVVTPKVQTKIFKLGKPPSPHSKFKSRRSGRPRKKTTQVVDNTVNKGSPRHVQTTLKDHFTVRRSTRKCKSVLEDEVQETMMAKLLGQKEDGLKVVDVEAKGRGIVASKHFSKGEFICEYSGELTTDDTARTREFDYQKSFVVGCYMYYFVYNGKKYCIDATKDNGRCGRLFNHSRTAPNVVTKVFAIDRHPYLCLMAGRDIEPGEELQYDYGDRRKSSLESHPWLKH